MRKGNNTLHKKQKKSDIFNWIANEEGSLNEQIGRLNLAIEKTSAHGSVHGEAERLAQVRNAMKATSQEQEATPQEAPPPPPQPAQRGGFFGRILGRK